MSTEVDLPSSRAQAVQALATSQATAVEQARAVAEVAAAVQVAQQFPRDHAKAIERMRQACRQKALAERAFYSLPRAGGRVEGSTVHLARELAACWTNVDYGVREMRRDDAAGESEMLAWAWDQENNVRSSRSFVVPHARMVRKAREALTDLGDIANNNNSVAARAVRETIFTILPVWFRTEAEAIAAETLKGNTGGKTLPQLVADMAEWFGGKFGVTRDQLEGYVDRPTTRWTEQDLAVLRVLGTELSRGEKRVEDAFPAKHLTAEDVLGSGRQATPADDPLDYSGDLLGEDGAR